MMYAFRSRHTVLLTVFLALATSQLSGTVYAQEATAIEVPTEAAEAVDPKLEIDSEQRILQQSDIAAYLEEIRELESTHGAYAAGLSQQIMALGNIYAGMGAHDEAIGQFKRSIHLSRINQGLNNPDQIPITDSLIDSYIAIGDLEEADNRQLYLYRIALQSYPADDPQRVYAMMDFADWQRRTYLARFGKTPYLHLLQMYDTYQAVLQLIASTHEDYSLGLLLPLNGLLSAHYLLSTHQGERSMNHRTMRSSSAEEGGSSHETRVALLRQMSFKQGKATLTAIRTIHKNNPDSPPIASTESTIAMGDWLMWHGKQSGARNAYQQAWAELAERPDAEAQLKRLFGKPCELPLVVEMDSGLEDQTRSKRRENEQPEWARIAVTVNERGRITSMNILESEPVEKSARLSQVLRNLRGARYRPVFEDGQPVTSEFEKRYDY